MVTMKETSGDRVHASDAPSRMATARTMRAAKSQAMSRRAEGSTHPSPRLRGGRHHGRGIGGGRRGNPWHLGEERLRAAGRGNA